jgi:hypothetical protein
MSASTKRLVPARARKPSVEIFAPPLLIAGEDSSRYHELVARVSAAVRPKDVLEEMAVRDIAYHDWEISRLRRIKSAVFASGLQSSLIAKLLSAPKMTESKARDLAGRFVAGDALAAKEVDKVLASVSLSIDAAMANTFAVRQQEFELIERLSASLEARRYAASRELERRRSALADARRREEEFVDADFEDAGSDEGVEPCPADDPDDDEVDQDCVVQGR